MKKYTYYVYILSSPTGTLYTGVTNNLLRRVDEHKNHRIKGFTSKYNITRLIFFEETNDVASALAREKEIKGWKRSKKLELIRSINPRFIDLSEDWFERSSDIGDD